MNNLRFDALALCVAFLVVAGAMPASAQTVPAGDDGNPECRAALQTAHDQLLAIQATAPLDAIEASRFVDQVAGPACGFSILQGQMPTDPNSLAADVAAVSGASGSAGPYALRALGDGLNPPKIVNAGKVVPCSLAGSGGGTITAQILGIVLDQQTAAGQWTGEGGVVHVAGTAASVSGSQAKSLGDMFVGPAGPLPSTKGDSGATCLQTETVTVVEESCWWLIFWTQCTQKVETSVSLSLCGASASQDMLGIGLLTYAHTYSVDNNPCDGGATDAPGNAIVVSDVVNVHMVLLTNQ